MSGLYGYDGVMGMWYYVDVYLVSEIIQLVILESFYILS